MVNEEIKYIKNTIKTFIGLKKKFDLRIMFLVFFPLRVFLCIPLIYETIKLSYFKICGYNILLTCFKGKKNKNSGLNEGWNRLCCLFKKKQQIFADKLVSQLHIWIGGRGTSFFPITLDTFPIKANTCCISHFPP